jgi:hypothetical protein
MVGGQEAKYKGTNKERQWKSVTSLWFTKECLAERSCTASSAVSCDTDTRGMLMLLLHVFLQENTMVRRQNHFLT